MRLKSSLKLPIAPVCVYIHVHIYTNTYIYMYNISRAIYIIYMYIYTHTHIYIYTFIYIYIHIYRCSRYISARMHITMDWLNGLVLISGLNRSIAFTSKCAVGRPYFAYDCYACCWYMLILHLYCVYASSVKM